jgi:hypothetical protein
MLGLLSTVSIRAALSLSRLLTSYSNHYVLEKSK